MVRKVDLSARDRVRTFADFRDMAEEKQKADMRAAREMALEDQKAAMLQQKFDLERQEFEEKKRKSEMMRQILGGGAVNMNDPMSQLGALAQVDERFVPDYLKAKIEYDSPEKRAERARQQRFNEILAGDTAMQEVSDIPEMPDFSKAQEMAGSMPSFVTELTKKAAAPIGAQQPSAPVSTRQMQGEAFPSQGIEPASQDGKFLPPDKWLLQNREIAELLGPDNALKDVYLTQQKTFVEQQQKIAEEKRKADAEGIAALRKQASAVPALDTKAKKVISTIDDARGLVSGATSGMGSLFSFVPGTSARNLQAKLDTIKANLGFEELQEMRLNSPTGGALGQVTERELAFLQSTIASLDQAQDPEQLMAALNTIDDYMRGRRERIINAYNQDLERFGAEQMSGLKPYSSELTNDVDAGFSIAPAENSDGWGIVE